MFIGHFAVGLAAKPAVPKVSLGTLMVAGCLADLIWAPFLLLGLEQVAIKPGITAANHLDLVKIAFSHSLLMDMVWATLLAVAYYARRRDRCAAWVLLALVLSHWVLDFISHRPDMPLAPGLEARYGLGLWNSVPATLLVEGLVWLGGILLYARATRPSGRTGTYVFWVVVVLLTAMWYLSLHAPPPPSLRAVFIGNVITFWTVIAWAYWVNRLRPAKT